MPLSQIPDLNWADFSIIGVIVFSTLISLIRGFVRECISLTTWAIALIVAFKYGNYLAKFLSSYVANPSLQLVFGFIILFVITLIFGAIINFFISIMIMKSGLSGTDRFLGMFFGAARGILLVTIILLMVSTTSFVKDPWWKTSYLIPNFKDLIVWVHGVIPQKMLQMSTFLNQ